MKIAILTQPLGNNYGGILQNFALQTVLRRMGHQPVTLKTPVPDARYTPFRLVLSCCKRALKKYLFRDPSIVFVNPLTQHDKGVKNAVAHRRFVEKYIDTEAVTLPLTSEFCHMHNFDAYVVGSDQVWRPRYNQYLQNFYLDFTQEEDVRRIAYAASFGVDEWEATALMTTQLQELAHGFDAVSVREVSGVELCRQYLGIDAEWVIDPTMLLSAEDYLQLVDVESHKGEPSYIGVYLLDLTKEKVAAIESLSRMLSLPIKYIGRMTQREYPSIESWLDGIVGAEYVVTDSFHGTVFSIIFKKRFLAVGNSARGNARFESLLSKFGLLERLATIDAVDCSRLVAMIDYKMVEELLELEQTKAIDFLNKTLK